MALERDNPSLRQSGRSPHLWVCLPSPLPEASGGWWISFANDPNLCSRDAIASLDPRDKAGSCLCDRALARYYLALHLAEIVAYIRIGLDIVVHSYILEDKE